MKQQKKQKKVIHQNVENKVKVKGDSKLTTWMKNNEVLLYSLVIITGGSLVFAIVVSLIVGT